LMIDVTPPGRRGAAFGVLTTANAAGNGGGPVFGSVMVAAAGLPALFLGMAPVLALAAWLSAQVKGGDKTTVPPEPARSPG
ncbi:MAG: MFS transporter, partial [Chloroflexota bacterium]